jgi:hypothetical protein
MDVQWFLSMFVLFLCSIHRSLTHPLTRRALWTRWAEPFRLHDHSNDDDDAAAAAAPKCEDNKRASERKRNNKRSNACIHLVYVRNGHRIKMRILRLLFLLSNQHFSALLSHNIGQQEEGGWEGGGEDFRHKYRLNKISMQLREFSLMSWLSLATSQPCEDWKISLQLAEGAKKSFYGLQTHRFLIKISEKEFFRLSSENWSLRASVLVKQTSAS